MSNIKIFETGNKLDKSLFYNDFNEEKELNMHKKYDISPAEMLGKIKREGYSKEERYIRPQRIKNN